MPGSRKLEARRLSTVGVRLLVDQRGRRLSEDRRDG
jgi:hypothetical protein